MTDTAQSLLSPIIALASSLAPGTVDALAQTVAACHPGDWSYVRAQVTQVVPQPQMRQTVAVAVVDDGQREGDETLTLTLHRPINAVVEHPAEATVTITEQGVSGEPGPVYLPIIQHTWESETAEEPSDVEEPPDAEGTPDLVASLRLEPN
jgi:hypothetical protein